MHKKEKQNSWKLEKDNTQSLRGILALAVLNHHLYHLYQKSGLFERTIVTVYLQAFGFLAVAEFFFLSGYGLTKSYKAQEKAYLNRFLQQRVLPYYSVMVLLVFVYGIEKIFLGIALDKKDVILSFFFGGMIISGGWYLQVQLVLYIMWFLVYRSFENWKFRRYIVLIGEIVFCLVMRGFGYSMVWYESVLAFYLGIAWADNENWIVKIINNNGEKLLL